MALHCYTRATVGNLRIGIRKKGWLIAGSMFFLCNVKVHPYDIRDVKPKTLVPLHLFKFMRREELGSSTFEAAENINRQYVKELKGVDIEFLFPGESFELTGNGRWKDMVEG